MNEKEKIAIYETALRSICRNPAFAQSVASNALQQVEMIESMISETHIERKMERERYIASVHYKKD